MPKNTAPSTEPKPKRTRVLSPEMAVLRERFRAEVDAMNTAKVSAKTLTRIINDMLPKLTPDDKTVLLNRISGPAN